MRFGVISRVAPLRIGVHMDYPLVHGPDLCRRLMPRPKLGRSRSTTAAAAPAPFRTVHLEVVGREQMAIPADTAYGHKPEDRFRRKGHDMTLGCIKARPRYQFQRFGLPRRAAFGGLHSLPSPIAGPRTFCRETLLQRFAEMSLKLRRSSRSCMTFIDQRAPVVGRVSTREHLRKDSIRVVLGAVRTLGIFIVHPAQRDDLALGVEPKEQPILHDELCPKPVFVFRTECGHRDKQPVARCLAQQLQKCKPGRPAPGSGKRYKDRSSPPS